MSAHCSPCAPGGVSQRICQSLWTDRTVPCALAGAVPPTTVSAKSSGASRKASGLPDPIVKPCPLNPLGASRAVRLAPHATMLASFPRHPERPVTRILGMGYARPLHWVPPLNGGTHRGTVKQPRSEERRVGKEWRTREGRDQ